MKLRYIIACVLAVLLSAPISSAASKEAPAPKKPVRIIPGEPARPYEVIRNSIGTWEVIYTVSFKEGAGLKVSYDKALRRALDDIQESARENGADAVINLKTEYVALPDGMIQQEAKMRGANVIGLISILGVEVKFLPQEVPASEAK